MRTERGESNPFAVLIVGCGNIAGRFDLERPQLDYPYTHAGAYLRDGRFKIAACVDPDDKRRREFMEAWDIPEGYSSIDQALSSNHEFDVVSICSPTDAHASNIETALSANPKAIFCEKPLTSSLGETEHLVTKCRQSNVLLAVNYTRRWDPEVEKLAEDIELGRRGPLRSISGLYNKGIFNNGSHMVDLLQFLVGPVEVAFVGQSIDDYTTDDPTIPVWLVGNGVVPIQLNCGYATDYAVFELQLIFSSGTLTMEDGGMFWRERRAVDSDTFKGYRKLNGGMRRPGKYSQAMLKAIDNIYSAIVGDKPLASTGDTALVSHRLCDQIKQLSCRQN